MFVRWATSKRNQPTTNKLRDSTGELRTFFSRGSPHVACGHLLLPRPHLLFKHVDAGEGVRAAGVRERVAGAGVPGGGWRQVQRRQRQRGGRRAQEPRPPPPKSVRADPGFPGWGSHALRVSCHCKVHASQTQDGENRPAKGGKHGRSGHGGHVDRGRGAPIQPSHHADRVRVPDIPSPARHPDELGGRGRELGEAQQGARRLRGAPVEAPVLGGRFHQLR